MEKELPVAFKPLPCPECGKPDPDLEHAPEDEAYFIRCEGCGHGGDPGLIGADGDENVAAGEAVRLWDAEWTAKHLDPLGQCIDDVPAGRGRKRI